MHKGFIWTATDVRTHEPVAGMQQLFAFDHNDAIARFRLEYGKAFDTVGHYLTGDSFSQWERRHGIPWLGQREADAWKGAYWAV